MTKKINFTEEQRKKIFDMYKKKSSYEISKVFKCSQPTITKALRENNIKIHPNGFFQTGRRFKYTEEQRKARSERIKKEYEKYPHLREIRSKQFKKNVKIAKEKGTYEKIRDKQRISLKESYASGEIKVWNVGLTKETDERVKIYAKKKVGTKRPDLSEKNKNPEYQRKCRTQIRPTRPEKIMMDIIEENNLPFNYVGKGDIWFKGENSMFNPDFLSKNPKHIIEVFGDYWHNLPNAIERDKKRLNTYKKYGYRTLVVWEHELKNKGNVLNKVRRFIA